jgi:drug/metabolite transporter (DMT)-like permease
MSRPTLALAVTVVTWASAFPAIRIALGGYRPTQVALLRYAIAGLLLAGYAVAVRLRWPPLRDSLRIAALGALGIAAYNVLLAHGQSQIPAGTASLLIASSPLWMVGFAALFAGERPAALGLVGLGLAFAGVLVIAIARGGGVSVDPHAAAILGAAMAGAVYSVLLRPYTRRHGAGAVLTVAVLGATLSLVPSAGGVVAAVAAAPRGATLAVVYLGVVPGVIGYAAWTYASARTTAVATGVALYLVPVLALGLAWATLGEVPALPAVIGGALVLAGVMVAQKQQAPRPEIAVRCSA